MADLCGFGDPGPITSAALKQGSDLGFADGVFFGHVRSLVKYSCGVKEQITKWMGHARLVSEKSISHVVAANIRYLMEQANLSQTALAKKAGLSQKTVSNYLNPDQRAESASGKASSPKLEELDKIARALAIPAWQLVREMTEKERRLYELVEKAYAELTTSPEQAHQQKRLPAALEAKREQEPQKASGKSSRSSSGAGRRKAA